MATQIMDPTTNPKITSFIEVAENSHFPIQNLPYGVFEYNEKTQVGVAIGNFVLDLAVLENHNFFAEIGLLENTFNQPSLNKFMEQGKQIWESVRSIISNILKSDNPTLRDNKELRLKALVPQNEIVLLLPVDFREFTDFYSSREHAFNVGTIIRGADNALMPNWLHLPVAYHGRSSSIILSDQAIYRPNGQTKNPDDEEPTFGPSKRLDFELEMGAVVGIPNEIGSPLNVENAEDHIFGLVLVNDWSARDIQVWEYRPLGPFLAKNFATSISPWIVPIQAINPFRVDGPIQKPEVLPYLHKKGGQVNSTFDINLQVTIKSEKMQDDFLLCESNYKYLYWSLSQQLTHHTITGCNMRTGDLFGSGTISGPSENSRGSMLEIAWKGEKPVKLPNGEERSFLQDGDEIAMTGYCQAENYRIGFGEVRTKILPTKNLNFN